MASKHGSTQSHALRSIVAGIAGIIFIVAGALGFMHESDSFFMQLKGDHLKYLAVALSERIDADGHAAIRTPADMHREEYWKISRLLEKMQHSTKAVISAYTFRIVDGEVLFIVSPPADYDRDGKISGELEVRDPVGLPYGEPPDEAMTAAAVMGRAAASPSFTVDRWGTFLTGCAPIRNSAGMVDGAVCVDEDAAGVKKEMRKINWMTSIFALISVLLLLAALAGYMRVNAALASRIAAERHRERALSRFESAIENAPMVAAQGIDRFCIIQIWNRASQITYGFPREEALGRNLAELIFEGDEAGKFLQAIKEVCEKKRPLAAREWSARNREGAQRAILLTIFPILEDGEIAEIFCMDVDITEEKKNREELQKSLDRMKAFYDMMVGRETRMLELKKEINDLCVKLGMEKRYTI